VVKQPHPVLGGATLVIYITNAYTKQGKRLAGFCL